MVDLRAGSLHLQGIDVVVPDLENLRTDRLAAVGLLPGTVLAMTDCTITLAGNRPGAALFVIQPEVASASTPASGGPPGRALSSIYTTASFAQEVKESPWRPAAAST